MSEDLTADEIAQLWERYDEGWALVDFVQTIMAAWQPYPEQNDQLNFF